jgi:hypothetical protein
VDGARRRLWLAFGLLVGTVGIGRAWDAYWHVTREFDTFFSPPHLFTYAGTGLSGALILSLWLNRSSRHWFGSPPWPPALMLGGYAILLLAGALDALWHTRFGLDETLWSTPHAMIGWGLLVIYLGFVCCALRRPPPRGAAEVTRSSPGGAPPSTRDSARFAPGRPSWPSLLLIGYFAFAFSPAPLLGPLYGNNTPATVQAVSAIPVLQRQEAAQHTFRIYMAWNLDRTHPLLLPLGALWAGGALAFVRAIDGRARTWLLAAAAWSLLTVRAERSEAQWLEGFAPLAGDPSAWLPLPVVFAAAAFGLGRVARLPERLAWPLAGLVFAVVANSWWGPHAGVGALALLAALACLLGAHLGRALLTALAAPSRRGVTRVLAVAIAMPGLTGLIDLHLRAATP